MSGIIDEPLIEPFDPMANRLPPSPRPSRPSGPGLKARVKRLLTRLADIFGDKNYAAAYRDDLNYSGRRLGPGVPIAESDSNTFMTFAEGIDPNLDSLKSTFGDVVEVATDLIGMIEASAKVDEDPRFLWNVIYYYIKIATIQAAKSDSPSVYALARLLTLISEDVESYETFDPARFMAVLRGETSAPDQTGQSQSQQNMDRVAPTVALAAGILKIIWDEELAEPLKGIVTFDYYFGWELIGEETAVADRIASRTLTVVLGVGPVADQAATPPKFALDNGEPAASAQDGSAAPFRVAATLVLVDQEHGGPGFIVSFGGDAGMTYESENFELEAQIGAAGGAAQFVSLSSDQSSQPMGGLLSPFGKLAFTVKQPDDGASAAKSGTRLEFQKIAIGAEAVEGVAAIILDIQDAALIIDPANAGRLLRSVIGGATRIDFGVRLRWDTLNGLHVDGGSGLRIVRTVEKPLLPALQLQQLTLALSAHPTDPKLVRLEVSAALASKLGGWVITVERMGLLADFGYDEGASGLPLIVRSGFKAPSGIGMQMRLANIEGGGYLYLDPDAGEYAGALQLRWGVNALTAIAAYRDGQEYNNFIGFLFGEFSAMLLPCIYLTGVGGMVGVNHTVEVEALEAGLRGGALEDLMFPANPLADAPRILNRIRTVFPPATGADQKGSWVAMIMARFTLGTPGFATIKLGVLIERSPDEDGVVTSKYAILMELLIRRPKKNPNFQMIIDAVIHWDRQAGTGGFMGLLRDSRIGKKHPIAITGMAVGRWGFAREGDCDPNWLISVGGFHPAFTDVPTGFPLPVQRLGAQFSAGPAKFLLEIYFAVGTATLQFGLSAFVQMSFGSITLLGRLGFDALINRDTNCWNSVGYGNFVVRYKDEDLCGIELSFRWSGPDPSELGGKCSLNFLVWKQEFSFLTTWGDNVAIPQEFSDSAEIMRAELANRANWQARLPRSVPPVLTFASQAEGLAVAAHPLGTIQFSQTRLPFELELQRIGDTSVRGPTRFAVENCRLGKHGAVRPPQLSDEMFALAEYRDLSDSETLARPQFERLPSGCRFGDSSYAVGTAPPDQSLECETLYIDPGQSVGHPLPPVASREQTKSRPDLDTIATHARNAGVGRAPIRRNARLTPAQSARFRVRPAALAAVPKGSLRAVDEVLSAVAQTSVALARAEIAKPGATRDARLIEAWELG